jgi:hypothetical protein
MDCFQPSFKAGTWFYAFFRAQMEPWFEWRSTPALARGMATADSKSPRSPTPAETPQPSELLFVDQEHILKIEEDRIAHFPSFRRVAS